MPLATRVGDKNTGHDECNPVPLDSGSPNVFINGKPAGRVDDMYSPHSCITHSSHRDFITSGSSKVFINGKPAARVGDSVSNNSKVAEGSNNVLIG